MVKLRALIVDDEYPARKELRFLLDRHDNIEVIGEAANAQEALELVQALQYSILFLDIEMPGMSGLELGRAIKKLANPPYVVFISAYDEYAVKAFEVDAIDYLLKPIDEKRLGQAIKKIERAIQHKVALNVQLVPDESEVPAPLPAPAQIKIDRIPAEKQGKTVLVNESDIIYVFTERDYVYIKTVTDKLSTRFTLKELENRLNPLLFFRTHRCCIVNLHKVKEIIPFFNGTYTLVVEDNQKSEVPVSRAQARKLRKILGM